MCMCYWMPRPGKGTCLDYKVYYSLLSTVTAYRYSVQWISSCILNRCFISSRSVQWCSLWREHSVTHPLCHTPAQLNTDDHAAVGGTILGRHSYNSSNVNFEETINYTQAPVQHVDFRSLFFAFSISVLTGRLLASLPHRWQVHGTQNHCSTTKKSARWDDRTLHKHTERVLTVQSRKRLCVSQPKTEKKILSFLFSHSVLAKFSRFFLIFFAEREQPVVMASVHCARCISRRRRGARLECRYPRTTM